MVVKILVKFRSCTDEFLYLTLKEIVFSKMVPNSMFHGREDDFRVRCFFWFCIDVNGFHIENRRRFQFFGEPGFCIIFKGIAFFLSN